MAASAAMRIDNDTITILSKLQNFLFVNDHILYQYLKKLCNWKISILCFKLKSYSVFAHSILEGTIHKTITHKIIINSQL